MSDLTSVPPKRLSDSELIAELCASQDRLNRACALRIELLDEIRKRDLVLLNGNLVPASFPLAGPRFGDRPVDGLPPDRRGPAHW